MRESPARGAQSSAFDYYSVVITLHQIKYARLLLIAHPEGALPRHSSSTLAAPRTLVEHAKVQCIVPLGIVETSRAGVSRQVLRF